jgi:hypothetical protein
MLLVLRRNSAFFSGLAFWSAALLGLIAAMQGGARDQRSSLRSAARDVWEYGTRSTRSLHLKHDDAGIRSDLRYGDPLFYLSPEGVWRQVGFVEQHSFEGKPGGITACWYADDLDPLQCRFELHENRGTLGDVVRTMFPAEKRLQLESVLRRAINEHGETLVAQMRPLITEALRDSVPVIEASLRESLHRHRPEINALAERYRQTIVAERLVPLIRSEVMPVVQEEAEPLARQIGRELWDRASLWRFGWRALYDSAPLTNRDLVRREFERFVREEATPVFASHTEDILTVQRRIIIRLINDPEVRRELGDVGSLLVNDQDLRSLLRTVLRETMVENAELHAVWLAMWNRQETQQALQLASERLEPIVRQIGDELFGTRDGGVSPSFARVLRNQILGKDKRWIVVVPTPHGVDASSGDVPRLIQVDDDTPYPLIVLANPNNA